MKLKAFPFINFFHWKIVKNDIKDFLNIFKKLNLKTFVAQYLAHVYIAENTSVIPVSYDKNQNYQMFFILGYSFIFTCKMILKQTLPKPEGKVVNTTTR